MTRRSMNIALLAAGAAPITSPRAGIPPDAGSPPPTRLWLFSESWPTGDYFGGYDTVWHETFEMGKAELVSSELALYPFHMPVLDIDAPVRVVESSPGRCHLYIDVPMSWRKYRRLLKALARAGVVEKEWAKLAISRRWSSVRVPWRLKGAGQ